MNNLATIEKIDDLIPHNNANLLEIAKVRGYNIIVPKDKYKVGSVVVLIHPDTILPEQPWAETFKKYAPKRVKALKIRGEFSFGIVVPIEDVLGVFKVNFEDNTIEIELNGVTNTDEPQPTYKNTPL